MTPRLAIFARAPVPGAVKTRLAAGIGATAALEAHRALLMDTLARLAPGSGRFAPELWLAGPLGEAAAWARCLPIRQQPAGDLGARMAAAFADGVTVLVGSDIPPLGAAQVEAALARLADSDVVLAPTLDGGYCLIALRVPCPQLFVDIPWGSSQVLAATKRAASERSLALLPPLWDVDDAADWRRWRKAAADAAAGPVSAGVPMPG